MKMKEELTPQQSFALISQIIDDRKKVYEENGYIIFLWGLTVTMAGIAQFILVKMEVPNSHMIWALTMIPLFVYTLIYYYRRISKSGRSGPFGDNVGSALWFMSGSMAMVSGFIFSHELREHMLTMMWLPFCVAAIGTAVFLGKRFFVYLSFLAAILAYGAMFVPFIYHPLVTAGLAFLLYLIPGYVLKRDYKKRTNV